MWLALLDRAVLGAVAAGLAIGLTVLAASGRRLARPSWLRRTLAGTLLVLAADVQIAALLLLLGPDGTQDGLLGGDVRLRNILGVAVSAGVWAVVWAGWRRRRTLADRGSRRGAPRAAAVEGRRPSDPASG